MSLTHKIMPNFFLLSLILFTSLLRTPNVAASAFPSCLNFGQEAQNLTSPAATFVLGFFQLNNHTYLGIWYSDPNPDQVIVWVANRDNPVPSQQYMLRIAADGNVEFRLKNGDSNGSTNHVFTAITTKPSIPEEVILCLGEDGNLVLTDRGAARGRILWQSFDSPTDTFLPGMNITSNSLELISWKSSQDPAKGDYSFQKLDNTALLINNISSGSNTPYWDSTYSSSLHPELISLLRNNMASTKENSSSSTLMRVVMASNGSLQLWELFPLGMEPDGLGRFPGKWNLLWTAPRDRCDLQIACGGFGVCNADNSFKCKCLPGYEPSDPDKWESGDFCGGCRKRTSQCGHKVLSLPGVKLPLDPDISYSKKVGSEAECREHVLGLGYCIFKAYAFDANQTCLIWTNQQPDLTHIQEEYDSTDAQTLNILVNPSDIESGSRTCRICGTNVIPYPLSTQEKCGDSNYFSFECNNTNGQVYFKPPSGRVHKVALINPNSSTFYVQLATTNSSGTCNIIDINSKVFSLNNSSPFSLKNCSDVTLNDERVVVVELSWKPPPQPDCKSLADCRDWPETTCKEDGDGRNVCLCAKGFYWNSLIMNCSQDHAHMPQAADHAHMPALAKAVIAVVGGVLLLLLGTKLLILRLQRRLARHRAGPVDRLKTDDIEDIDIPYIDYESVLVVTDNFSDSNKLGAGGFGPVYRGKLADGNEVAVKRLSTTSVQGIEEFRNEVILIAKLQHRNLVRVLGYCMNEEEKILIYEYMPNKCLSSFLFDQSTSPSLDWKKRFNIILGIARGLVYLHQDSRLRIIHRDLKPSNILLDQDLNPKISDFGIARIVAGSDIATTTARVVGTYGYMSPEYALDGYFSVKSDVYSFGIILLEVISGRTSTSLFRFQNNLISLIGYSWNLWDKERALELVDQSIVDSCDSFEVQRCIKVGLLCVQEDPSDRPTMSTVLLMLGGGDMSLPYPKQPVFVARKPPSETASSSSGKFGSSGSNVELTTAIMEGR